MTINIGDNPDGTKGINKFISKTNHEGLSGKVMALDENKSSAIMMCLTTSIDGDCEYGKLYLVQEVDPDAYPLLVSEVSKVPSQKQWQHVNDFTLEKSVSNSESLQIKNEDIYMNHLSENQVDWILFQTLFKEHGIKNAKDVLQFIREEKIYSGNYFHVSQTYFGVESCPVCFKDVDAMMWDGNSYYFEIDYSKETSSPVHWCDLEMLSQTNNEIKVLIQTVTQILKEKRLLV